MNFKPETPFRLQGGAYALLHHLDDLVLRIPPGLKAPAFAALVEILDYRLRTPALRARAIREKAEAAAAAQAAAREAALNSQIYHGVFRGPGRPPTWSHVGFRIKDGNSVALSREGGQVFAVAGTIGSGKSQALLALIESCIGPLPPLTSPTLPPTAAIAIHADLDNIGLPELCSAVAPTDRNTDIEFLRARLGTEPEGLPTVRLLCHRDEVARRRAQLDAALGEHAHLVEVRPLRLRLGQIGMQGLAALCGAPPTRVPAYLQTLLARARDQGDALNLRDLRHALAEAPELTERTRALAESRLAFLDSLEDPGADLWDDVAPEVLTIYDLSGRWLRRQDVFPLAIALISAVSQPSDRHGPLQRLLAIDEINRLGADAILWEHLVMTCRQARHRGLILWLAGQDLLSVPTELLALATQVLLFRVSSPEVFADIKRRVSGFARWSIEDLTRLYPGQALWLSQQSCAPELRGVAALVYLRPPACAHGGHTRAVL